MVLSDLDGILVANADFYDAHERRDFDRMCAVWEHSDRATCVHPGWPILRGWDAVRDSWERILNGPGRNQFITTNVSVEQHGEIAWVTLDENLMQGARTGTVAATNMFGRSSTGWKLILHHGSPVMAG